MSAWRRVAVGLLLSAFSPLASADDTADGLLALRDGDPAAARGYWQQAAAAGDGQAMFLLSTLYARGMGVEADQAMALRWLQAAAESDYALASYNLGGHYLNGVGVAADPAQAAYWWRRAALQGLPQAQYNLGSLYYRGLGVEKDIDQALWWYRQAAAQGSERATELLARLQPAEVVDSPEVQEKAEVPSPSPDQPTQAATDDLSAIDGLTLGADWLRRQPPTYFTVQVFASQDLSAVRKLLVSNRFARQVAVYSFHRDGQRWYGVIYGRFADRATATAALTELPASLHKGKPWVRQIKDLITILASTDS